VAFAAAEAPSELAPSLTTPSTTVQNTGSTHKQRTAGKRSAKSSSTKSSAKSSSKKTTANKKSSAKSGKADKKSLQNTSAKTAVGRQSALNNLKSSDALLEAIRQPGTSAKKSAQERQFTFQQLDRESEQLLKEVLDLSSDLAIVEEQQNNPAKFQLLVLVTMAPTELFKLDYLELKIDNQTVAAHNYTSSEFNALQLGGGQRLYVANLPAGMHKMHAMMAGRVPRDPDYKSDVDYSFISGVSRTVLELSVSGKQTRGFPILQVVEHN